MTNSTFTALFSPIRKRGWRGLALALLLLACSGPGSTTVVDGLTNPRSLALLPDGRLLVAEAGSGDGHR
jgi:hypothetical protein